MALPFYNGLVGPGTGTMMVVALTTILGIDFTRGSATSKIVNLGSDLGALLVFAWHGQVLWLLGLGMAACNMLGSGSEPDTPYAAAHRSSARSW